MEVSAEAPEFVLNNIHEAHGLYHILEKLNLRAKKDAEQSFLTIQIGPGENNVISEGIIYLNSSHINLAVSARGEYNPYINAIVSSLLT